MANVGIGFKDLQTSIPFAIPVSDSLDYEISFWFRQPNRLPSFEVSIKTFNCDFTTEYKPIDIRSGAFNNVLLPGNVKVCGKENQWNFWHGVLYNKNQVIVEDKPPLTSHAAGTNLIMHAGTAKLFVNVFCTANCLLIWDFKIKPLKTPFSTPFLGCVGLLEIFRKNNRVDLNQDQVDVISENVLFPYNSSTAVVEL